MNEQLLIFILFLLFFIRTISNSLYLVFLWQLKEYRWDRMVAFLKTTQGKRIAAGKLSILKWILIFLGTFIYFDAFFTLFVIGIYLIEAVYNLREITADFKKPKLTPKATFLFTLVTIFEFGCLLLFFSPVSALILDKLLPIFVAFWVALLSIPSKLVKKIYISLAKKKMRKLFKGKVVGITGSVGKTSVKEFAATILGTKYIVKKTSGSQNIDIGIAKTILEKISGKEDIFIVEIGAYHKGEIRNICEIVHPEIGVITSIGTQHIDLFGSQKGIVDAKFELIESLPKHSTAIFNGDNSFCLDMSIKAKGLGIKTFLFGIKNKSKTDILAKDIKIYPDKLEFLLQSRNITRIIKANLLGFQNVPNLLAAIAICLCLNMKPDEISRAIKQIESPQGTMRLARDIKGAKLIDDTFNASDDSIASALDYMNIYKGKKILVLTPIIELGSLGKAMHESLGEKSATVCDLILLTNINYYDDFIIGAKKVLGGENKVQIINRKGAVALIKKTVGKDAVVLFEGKESTKILKELI